MGAMSTRHWISAVTVLLVVMVLYFGRHELLHAVQLLSQVNVWILLLLIPIQFASYFAAGATIFSYLKSKGPVEASRLEVTKMSLELNFVNHILPSGGVSGASYMTWRLRHIGVGAGRATMAQFVRFAMTFAGFLALLGIALLVMTLDGSVNRFILMVSSFLGAGIIAASLFVIYVVGSRSRLVSFSHALTRQVNRLGRRLGRKKPWLASDTLTDFFEELHDDYVVLKKEPRALIWPFFWGVLFNVFELLLFVVAFWALGTPVNPAALFIAYGLGTLAGVFLATPGGAGGYEALMIIFLASAGVPQGVATAGVVLARAILIVGTIASGYIFYQLALNKYGKRPDFSK